MIIKFIFHNDLLFVCLLVCFVLLFESSTHFKVFSFF